MNKCRFLKWNTTIRIYEHRTIWCTYVYECVQCAQLDCPTHNMIIDRSSVISWFICLSPRVTYFWWKKKTFPFWTLAIRRFILNPLILFRNSLILDGNIHDMAADQPFFLQRWTAYCTYACMRTSLSVLCLCLSVNVSVSMSMVLVMRAKVTKYQQPWQNIKPRSIRHIVFTCRKLLPLRLLHSFGSVFLPLSLSLFLPRALT